MDEIWKSEQLLSLNRILKAKQLRISERQIDSSLNKIIKSQQIFPLLQQRALLVQLLNIYEKSKKREVIILEELGNKEKIPVTIVLGALAEDWPGMSNSILGIVHHRSRNVLFIKGFTVEYEDRTIGLMILCFKLSSRQEYDEFLGEKKELVKKIKDAAIGTPSKYLLLEDETIKFEIYNDIVKQIKATCEGPELVRIIGEDGEALKFVSSRSREYLEERRIKDLAHLIIDNYRFQQAVKSGSSPEMIKIGNLTTKYEKLTGITFVCKEELFSVEDFLKTLDYIVPGHIIKHHKSFVNPTGILVYRIEIVDRYGEPLKQQVIHKIEKTLQKLIVTSTSKKFLPIKAIGGFEHYARAIIPFLKLELKQTNLAQVFINADKRTDFSIDIKLVVVSYQQGEKRIHRLIARLEELQGIEINSSIPPKFYADNIEIDILKLNVNLSEFSSIKDIFNGLKRIIREVYGEIRDFDQGFREIDFRLLNELLEKLSAVNMPLVRDIFFNFDELYRIEIPFEVLYEVIRLCARVVEKSKGTTAEKVVFKFKNLKELSRSIAIISFTGQKKILSQVIDQLKDFNIYFTKIEWDQRSYFILVLRHGNRSLSRDTVKKLKEQLRQLAEA
jgi:hypothetical protein